MKVFISYSTKDRPTAASLFRDLRAAGAEAFQFGRSETLGTPAWGEIVEWINQSDAFVALISSSALASSAVKAEIDMAFQSHMESEGAHPAKIVPAIIQARVTPPLLIRHMARLDLVDYAAGLSKLLRQLGLKLVAPGPPSAAPSLPQVDIFRLAPSAPPNKRLADAKQLLRNYDELKPAGLPKDEEEQHVNSLLARVFGKSPDKFADPTRVAPVERAFLGVEPSEQFRLSDRLINFDAAKAKTPLEAPAVINKSGTLSWVPIVGATGYTVGQRSDTPGVQHTKEVHRGVGVSYRVPDDLHMYASATFHVKATGGVFRPDSPWSNGIRFEPVKAFMRLSQLRSAPLPLRMRTSPPSLEITLGSSPTEIVWSKVQEAEGYVLERRAFTFASGDLVQGWKSIYEGPLTKYYDLGRRSGGLFSYRVKARGPWGETEWSTAVDG
jgi:hypothetical protein